MVSAVTKRKADAAPAGLPAPESEISELRNALIRALRASPEAREPLCDALELLEGLQQRLGVSGAAPPASRPATRRRSNAQSYFIEQTAEGPFLTETRPGQGQPFRCPRETYLATAEVLAADSAALHFEELLEKVNAKLSERQSEYRVRVALRFWMNHGAVGRFRAKYQPEGDDFLKTARQLWDELASSSGR